jgi:hypothetical protein
MAGQREFSSGSRDRGKHHPVPPEMAALQVRYKSDGWPDMRTRAGKRWAEMFRAIEDEQIERYYSKAETA